MSKHIGFLDSAIRVLEDAGEPLHYREITERALAKGWLVTEGATPEATMSARIGSEIKKAGGKSRLLRTEPGVIGLRRWVEDGTISEMSVEKKGRSFVPHYPTYDQVRALLPAWDGLDRSAITGMRAAIMNLTGTPEEQVSWTEPDVWIAERLVGEARDCALTTWEGSGRIVNPRYTVGHWSLVSLHRLLVDDDGGPLRISEAGRNFIAEEAGATVRRLDKTEGLLEILRLIAEAGSPAVKDLLPDWMEYLQEESNVRTEKTARSYLDARMRNLIERGYVERVGTLRVVSDAGMSYLEAPDTGLPPAKADPGQNLQGYLAEQRRHVRELVEEILVDIDPYVFEHVVKRLLVEMGYEDVKVTAQSNDKGVDVIGSINVGITSIREVVQVKRQRANVQRGVVDALRGSLHRFKATRGTVITTSGFSKGARDAVLEVGGAPVTLIDGKRLIDLLIEYEVGVQKKKVDFWEVDTAAFAAEISPDDAE